MRVSRPSSTIMAQSVLKPETKNFPFFPCFSLSVFFFFFSFTNSIFSCWNILSCCMPAHAKRNGEQEDPKLMLNGIAAEAH